MGAAERLQFMETPAASWDLSGDYICTDKIGSLFGSNFQRIKHGNERKVPVGVWSNGTECLRGGLV